MRYGLLTILLVAGWALFDMENKEWPPTGLWSTSIRPSFDAKLHVLRRDYDIPGLVYGILRDGVIQPLSAQGQTADGTRPVSTDSIFLLASLSKPITAAAVLVLASRGKLPLDAPVDQWFNDLSGNTGITVRELLNHSSGIDTRGVNMVAAAAAHPEPSQFARYLLSRPLAFTPGRFGHYDNGNYVVLSALITRVCGCEYATFVRQKVLEPLRMTQTRFGTPPAAWKPGTAYLQPSFDITGLLGAGGWTAPAIDLLRFLEHWQARLGLDSSVLEEVDDSYTRPDSLGNGRKYGLGWHLHETVDNKRPIRRHYGSLPGAFSQIGDCGNGDGWIVLLNSRPTNRAADRTLDGRLFEMFSQRACS
ncbi:MAG: serine hydrolase domain-containing protein [Salinisphaeraceae bacterium]